MLFLIQLPKKLEWIQDRSVQALNDAVEALVTHD